MFASSPFGPAGEIAAARHGALTRTQAAASGITPSVLRRLLRDEVLREPVPGVLVATAAPVTWRQRIYVATLASRGAGAAAGRSAAALHGIDGFPEGPLELLVPSSRHIRLPGLVVRRGPMDRADLFVVDQIRTTTIARTLCDLGELVDDVDLRIAFEWAWRSGVSLLWLRRTAERLARPNRRGPRRLLGLLDDTGRRARPTESTLEVHVEDVLDALPGIVRQYRVVRPDGSLIGRVDFAIPELRIAIEAHSRAHHVGPFVEEADAAREAELHAQGWIVRYVTDGQRRRPEELRRTLLALIAARRASAA